MDDPIPAVKLPPNLLPRVCQLFVKNLSKPDVLKSEIVAYIRSASIRRNPPSEKNAFRAVTLPSLRHLGLIEGKWPDTRPTADMVEIVRAFDQGSSQGKRVLGRIVASLDMKGPRLIDSVKNIHPATNIDNLVRLFAKKIGASSEKEFRELQDRMNRWIGYLRFVEIISDTNDLKLNQTVLQLDMNRRPLSVSQKEFLRLLSQKYKELRRGNPDITYVPIPLIRDAVCLAKPGMLSDDFYEMLREAKNGKHVRMLLSEPMTRQEGGLRLGDKYYYYFSLYE
jgi:hypothetical protein